MNGYLRQSTASQVRTIGAFVNDTDFKTLENALTIANTDIVISKNGAADTVKNSGGATAHGAGGIYTLTWDATDTDTVGELYFSVKVAGALVVFGSYVVLEEAAYDAMYASAADPKADINVATIDANAITATAIAADAITAAKIADGAIDAATFAAGAIDAAAIADGAIDAATFGAGAINAAAIAADAIGASELAADAVAEIADQVWDEVLAGHLTAGSTGAALNAAGAAGDPWGTALPGAYGAGTAGKIVGDNLNATVSSRASAADLATVQADTDNIQTRLPAALVSGRMDSSVGAVAAGAITAAGIATGAIDADALATDAVDEIVDGVWDEAVDGAVTARQSLRLANSANGGKLSGAATTNVLIRDLADSKDRVNATVDASGNRTAVTRDLT